MKKKKATSDPKGGGKEKKEFEKSLKVAEKLIRRAHRRKGTIKK